MKKIIRISGMTCPSCATRVEKAVRGIAGVNAVDASYECGVMGLTYDGKAKTLGRAAKAIDKLGYKAAVDMPDDKLSMKGLVAIALVLFGIYWIIQNTVGFHLIPVIDQSMSYGIIFVAGLMTSIHCIAMCGGVNLSQSVSGGEEARDKLVRGSMYNLGRVASYTLIGGIVGAMGSVIGITNTGKAAVTAIAGVFMIVAGLNMLGDFPWLKRLQPRMPKSAAALFCGGSGKKGPFAVGMLNGLMPCGPLQSMQLYALGTGGFVSGAVSMFLFSAGTVPLMFGLSAVSSFISARLSKNMMRISAALVLLLGLVMLNRALGLSGFEAVSRPGAGGAAAEQSARVQEVTTRLKPFKYEAITVKKGVPVRWMIEAEQSDLNGCNNAIYIPEYEMLVELRPGENLIEFMPLEAGTYGYSCWMGMISSKIIVIE